MNWEQFKTILWLRRHLTLNQFSRSGAIGQILAVIIPVAAFLVGWCAFVVGLLAGWYGLGHASPMVISMVWLGVTGGFLLFWTLGLLTELQRSESIDLQRLMHLPVRLGQVFVINFIASHFVLTIVAFVPAMSGLALGLAISRGVAMLLLIPLALAMVFMISAWTYCLRGWLGALMTNPRKRRAIIAGITLAIILAGQTPNLFNVFVGDRAHGRSSQVGTPRTMNVLQSIYQAERYVPPLWLAVGGRALAEHRALPAVLGTLGCLAIGALGVGRAYRITVRSYRGDTDRRSLRRIESVRDEGGPAVCPANARGHGATFLERRIPGVPDEAAALALATFRSLMRAPEVKMALASSFIVPVIFGGTFLFRSSAAMPDGAKPFIAAGAVVFSVFMTIQFLANQFGYDRAGFRALVLSPASRRNILLGKNLATLPFSATIGLVLVVAAAIGLRMPLVTILAALFQLLATVVLAGVGGNLLSVYVPYRIQAGSMKPSKPPGKTLLTMMVFQMMFPLAMAPVFIPPAAEFLLRWAGLPRALPVNLILSIALTVAAVIAYRLSLAPIGRILQSRETAILQAVTTAVE